MCRCGGSAHKGSPSSISRHSGSLHLDLQPPNPYPSDTHFLSGEPLVHVGLPWRALFLSGVPALPVLSAFGCLPMPLSHCCYFYGLSRVCHCYQQDACVHMTRAAWPLSEGRSPGLINYIKPSSAPPHAHLHTHVVSSSQCLLSMSRGHRCARVETVSVSKQSEAERGGLAVP